VSLDDLQKDRSTIPGNSGHGSIQQPPSPIDLETPTHRGDVIAASLCLGAGLAGYLFVVPAAVHVPAKFAGTVNSPAFLPNALFILLAGLGAVYLVQSVITYLREARQGRARNSDWALAGGTALICVGYIAAIYLVGLTLGSALCVAATIFYFGERRLWIIGLIAVILPSALLYFFVKIANILLPSNALGLLDWLESSLPSDGIMNVAALSAPLIG